MNLQLQPEIEAQLTVQAQAYGLTTEKYAEKLLTERIKKSDEKVARENRLADLELFFEEMAIPSDKIPQLPDEAYTRESFYKDRY